MKAINLVLGLATAIVLGALINLGIAAFYPEPEAPQYPTAMPAMTAPCPTNDVTCISTQQKQTTAQQAEWQVKEDAYQSVMKVYNRNLFIIANILGLIVFALGFWMIFGELGVAARGVPVGMMLAGLWSIIYGYGRGWGSVNDQIKFFIGLGVAIVMIGGSVWLVERYQKKA